MVYRALAEHFRRGFKLVCNERDLGQDGMAFVYHHFSICLFYWLNSQCNYDGDAYFSIVLNGTIHFIMYGYYFATSFNISVPTFIKKSITNAQLTQFCLMELQGVALLTMNGCGSSRRVTILYMVYISTMLALFMNFKRQNYKKTSKKIA